MESALKLPALLREPLFHFLMIGVALFLLYGRVAGDSVDGASIDVGSAKIAAMSSQFQARWSRPPNAQELKGLIDSYIHDEVLYREGLALGLDADDPVIKRRIRQKLDVMAEEAGQAAAPAEVELNTYFLENADRFRQPMVVSFEQVFFSGDAPVAEVEKLATDALKELRGGAPASGFGQPTMLPAQVTSTSIDLVIRDFGLVFSKQLEGLPLDTWKGPIASSLGAHLVRVTERTPATMPALAEVRPLVLREWENERRERNRAVSYRAMMKNYRIVVEGKPVAVGESR